MTTTMNLIAKQTVGAGGAASVSFQNIPQTFTDLKIVISARTLRSGTDLGDEIFVQFNGDTGNNYATKMIEGDGSGTRSAGYSSQPKLIYSVAPTDNATANTFGNAEYYIPNYTSTSNYKSVSYDAVMENNATLSYNYLNAGLWSATPAAITSITISAIGTWVEFSTFYLYGISNSTTTQNTTTPSASGGDVITTDGTYWYHAFKYSGSFVPLKNLTADVLVVAGGGGGGGYAGGGGGAGGLLLASSQSLSTTGYTVTVGAGGGGYNVSTNGVNSQIGSSTAIGGGHGAIGGGGTGVFATTGGSGGGGGTTNSSYYPGAAGTSGQGFAGGSAGIGGALFSAGGGGAGAIGSNASGNFGGNGGIGTNSYSSWTSVTGTGVSGYIAGGGGGGVDSRYTSNYGLGGLGGGGNAGVNDTGTGANTLSPSNGIANSGGGGGGGGGTGATGGNGGSGLVIVRYAV